MLRQSITMLIQLTCFILGIFYSIPAYGDFFCYDDISQRVGDVLKVCGVGVSDDLSKARDAAWFNALDEASKECHTDSTCRTHKLSVTELRSVCRRVDGDYECRRLIRVEILAQELPVRETGTRNDSQCGRFNILYPIAWLVHWVFVKEPSPCFD